MIGSEPTAGETGPLDVRGADSEPTRILPANAPSHRSDLLLTDHPLAERPLTDRLLTERTGPVRRVMFFGKSMSRTRCTGALVDALERHGVEVRWRNMVTLRRWFGQALANRLARAEFRRFRPDTVFVFYRDLPLLLASEFRQSARLVIWCEEALENLDESIIDYFAQADLVCMSNPQRFAWLRERGLDNMVFLMSGFSPRYHRAAPKQPFLRDVAFIGSPGRRGQRAEFLAQIGKRFHTEVFGLHWERWPHLCQDLRVHAPIDNRRYAKVCATSRIVIGLNEVNDDSYYFSNRTFLTLACGGFHLTHYVPKLENVFKHGEHLAWYRNEDEALQQIEHWLPRDDERARVAAGGHGEVMQHHQYFHRVARILHCLKEGVPKATGPDVDLVDAAAAVPERRPNAASPRRPREA